MMPPFALSFRFDESGGDLFHFLPWSQRRHNAAAAGKNSAMRKERYTGERWLRRTGRWLGDLVWLSLLTAAALYLTAERAAPFTPAPTPEVAVMGEATAAPASAWQTEAGLFGNLTVTTERGVSLPAAQLLVNGEPSGDFADGRRTVRVYPGDVVAVDASAYRRRLTFTVAAASASICIEDLPAAIDTEGNCVEIGVIRFK